MKPSKPMPRYCRATGLCIGDLPDAQAIVFVGIARARKRVGGVGMGIWAATGRRISLTTKM